MRYLSVDDVIHLNRRIVGAGSRLRDRNMLESAIERPKQTVFGEDAYPTLTAKAAALFHSLVLNHPFMDGNKRTATVAVGDFLKANGRTPRWNHTAALTFIIETAQGLHGPAEIADWLEANTEPVSS